MTTPTYRKKLIEVALPLEAINRESAREKSIRHGHPSTLHLWWARRPLAACRAVIFASLIDDPSSRLEEFPTEELQDRERQRLFRLIEELVKWENTTNETVLSAARAEILRSTGGNPPPVLDPFAGGGSIPLEAQRLGLEAHASDLNPVPVLINKALIEIPPKFAGRPPVNPAAQRSLAHDGMWKGAAGLAEDVRYYGRWMRDEAKRRVGALYPKVRQSTAQGYDELTVITWLWARTVICPNPACGCSMPLVNSFVIANRPTKKMWARPVVDADRRTITFVVAEGRPTDRYATGTVSRTGAVCLACGTPAALAYVRAEARAGRMGAQLLCTVGEGAKGRTYVDADATQVQAAQVPRPEGVLTTDLPVQALGFRVQAYGLTKHEDLFSARQATVLDTFCRLMPAVAERLKQDGASSEYASAVLTYLGMCISRLANRCSSQSFWHVGGEKVEQVFGRNALPMIWVYAEANPFSDSSGNFVGQVDYLAEALSRTPAAGRGIVQQADAANPPARPRMMVVTDPPYYDNVPYADLSDFFYVWLRRALGDVMPDLFGTMLVPKAEELIAEPARHGGWDGAAAFFETGLRRVFANIVENQVPDYPFAVFYAFKQSEEDDDAGHASTGWETMLQGLVDAGSMVDATWPVRTEQPGGLREVGRNALASSIVLVCRTRPTDAPTTTRNAFLRDLKRELPQALRALRHGNIAPVDLAQAAIGPGMAIFSRYGKVLESDGSPMRVRTALALINQQLDEVLTEQEGELDADTRWAVTWFDQFGFGEGPFGDANTLANAMNTGTNGLVEAGIIASARGKVRLLKRDELPKEWDPTTDARRTVWEAAHHLIRTLDSGGERAAASLLAQLGEDAERARDLAYRLYTTCERRGWAQDAQAYNSLVVAWPELSRLSSSVTIATAPGSSQQSLGF
jgi:putative DNA methylase